MNQLNHGRIVTLKDLWQIFLQRFVIIFLAGAIALISSVVITRNRHTPLYSSTATMYILRQNDKINDSAEAYNEFTFSLRVVNDCSYLLKSRTVVNQVIQDLSLDMSYEELSSRITTNNPTSTRILEVTVQMESPQLSKQIADRVCELGQTAISDAMGFNQVNFFEKGTLTRTPCNNINYLVNLIIGVGVAAAAYIFFLLAYLLDDRIRTAEDIEQCLGLTVLGEIVNTDENQKGRGYGYGRYSAYGGKHDKQDQKEARS